MKKALKTLKTEAPYLLFILPAFLGYTVFSIVPLFKSFAYAFTDWDGYSEANFVGLKNFQDLIGDAPMMTRCATRCSTPCPSRFWSPFWPSRWP